MNKVEFIQLFDCAYAFIMSHININKKIDIKK